MQVERETVINLKLNYVLLEESPEAADARTKRVRIVILREEGAEIASAEDGKVQYFPLE